MCLLGDTGGWAGARWCIRASGAPGARTASETVSWTFWASSWPTASSHLQTGMSTSQVKAAGAFWYHRCTRPVISKIVNMIEVSISLICVFL